MNRVQSFLIGILLLTVLLCVGLAAGWVRITKPLPVVAVKASDVELVPAESAAEDEPKGWTCTYLNKPRSRKWFDDMYKKYAMGIVLVEGKYVDIRIDKARSEGYAMTVPVGNYCHLQNDCQILQVVSDTDVLLGRPGRASQFSYSGARMTMLSVGVEELRFHVRMRSTKGLVDGAKFESGLVRNGTYSYTSAATGARRTVESYVVHEPLSEQQFADALSKGFVLDLEP